MAGGYSKLKLKAGTQAQKNVSTNVLGDREVALIYPETIGKGNAKMITGDGATPIKDLSYSLGEDATDMVVKTIDSVSESNANIEANKPLRTLLGAIKTKLSSLTTTLAQKINYSDIYAGTDSTNNKIPLAASIGKKLQDQVTQLNGDFTSTIFKKDGLAALQSNSRMGSTRLQIMDDKNYVELFRSTDSWKTYKSLGILATMDETVLKDESNSLSNKNYYTLQVGLNADSFRNAGLNILTRKDNSEWARPGIGFEREGVEGAYLYYEDGKFYFCDHHGIHHQITST